MLRSTGPSRQARRALGRSFHAARASLRGEDARLREHFRGALEELAGADTSSLAVEQRDARARVTSSLRAYAARGRFPRNDRFPGKLVPFFIDRAGTRCAVAHLVEHTGDAPIARAIRATVNNGLVGEFVAPHPAIVAWAQENGLSLAELSRIQPSYCFVTNADACFCPGSPAAQVAEVSITTASTQMGTVTSVQGTGPLKVGDTVMVYTAIQDGDVLLVTSDAMGNTATAGKLTKGDPSKVDTSSCGGTAPALSKADATAALFATAPGGDASSCSAALDKVNDYWGTSQCDNDTEGGGGCSIGSPMPGPFAFTALALGMAAWLQRRRARRARLHERTR